MDESVYSKICVVRQHHQVSWIAAFSDIFQAYFSAASELHTKQVKAFISICNNLVKKTADEEADGKHASIMSIQDISYSFIGFSGANVKTAGTSGIRRAGTIVRSPLEGRKEKRQQADGDLRVSEVSRQ